MIRPSDGSTPPQKESGSESTNAGPEAWPATSAFTLDAGPETRVMHNPPLRRGPHALSEAAECHLYPEVPGGVVRPLPRVRHDHAVMCTQDRCDVGAGVRDDGDP